MRLRTFVDCELEVCLIRRGVCFGFIRGESYAGQMQGSGPTMGLP